jgi:hypothetical protein
MYNLKSQMWLTLALLLSLSTGWSQQALPYIYQPHPMLGMHTIQTAFGDVSISVSAVARSEEPSLDTSSTYVSYYRLSAHEIILLYHGKLEFCEVGCKTKEASHMPHVFFDMDNGKQFVFAHRTLHLEATCPGCTDDDIKGVVQNFILDIFDLHIDYEELPAYLVCQNTAAFLRHYHSGEDPFSALAFHKYEYDSDSTYLHITNIGLDSAIRYLGSSANLIVRRDPNCSFYTRSYTKPFSIRLKGTDEEILEDFEERHFVEIHQVPWELFDAMIFREN